MLLTVATSAAVYMATNTTLDQPGRDRVVRSQGDSITKLQRVRPVVIRVTPVVVRRVPVRGFRGFTGAQGQPGQQGATGATGKAGKNGRNGAPGQDGVNGLTPAQVTQIANDTFCRLIAPLFPALKPLHIPPLDCPR